MSGLVTRLLTQNGLDFETGIWGLHVCWHKIYIIINHIYIIIKKTLISLHIFDAKCIWPETSLVWLYVRWRKMLLTWDKSGCGYTLVEANCIEFWDKSCHDDMFAESKCILFKSDYGFWEENLHITELEMYILLFSENWSTLNYDFQFDSY